MNVKECKALNPGDRIRAANGQTGIVILNTEQITVQWDATGHSTTGPHNAAWMCEQISCAVHNILTANRNTKRTRNNDIIT